MEFPVYLSWGQLPPEKGQAVDRLLQSAFPPEERRALPEVHHLLGNSCLELLTAEEAGRVQGFMMVWNLPDMVFLENFAVDPLCRGHGLGASMLEEVGQRWKKPMLLEVEPPEGEIQRRRIGFYRRNGFVLNDFPYQMPCLHGDGPALPLLLMSRPKGLTHEEARAAAERLYDTVYCGKRRPRLP